MNQRTIIAVFDSMGAAEKATHALAMKIGGVRATIHSQASNDISGVTVAGTDRAALEEALRRGGAVVSAEVSSDNFEMAADALEGAGAVNLDHSEAEWRREGWQTGRTPIDADAATTGVAMTGVGRAGAMAGDDSSIPLAEEHLKVGKREVAHGRVRIRSYVVETPVQQQVTLHQENVQVERRAVDRPVSGAEDLFRERSLEATETSEEAVVAKEVRVREEISLRKTSDDEVRTISDTVRRTEVQVDDDRDPKAKSGTPMPGIKTDRDA